MMGTATPNAVTSREKESADQDGKPKLPYNTDELAEKVLDGDNSGSRENLIKTDTMVPMRSLGTIFVIRMLQEQKR